MERSSNAPATAAQPGLSLLDAEMALWLPGRPQVRRELLRLSEPDRHFVLRPDGSPAGVELVTATDGFHGVLAGPDRADLEVTWTTRKLDGIAVPAWAIASGPEAEASVWDAFGRLVIPDLLARGVDAEDIQLVPGRYVLTASVQGRCSMMLGLGFRAAVVRERLRLAV